MAKPRVKFQLDSSPIVVGVATRVHGFATKTKALAREIPPATQAKRRMVMKLVKVLCFICFCSDFWPDPAQNPSCLLRTEDLANRNVLVT